MEKRTNVSKLINRELCVNLIQTNWKNTLNFTFEHYLKMRLHKSTFRKSDPHKAKHPYGLKTYLTHIRAAAVIGSGSRGFSIFFSWTSRKKKHVWWNSRITPRKFFFDATSWKIILKKHIFFTYFCRLQPKAVCCYKSACSWTHSLMHQTMNTASPNLITRESIKRT